MLGDILLIQEKHKLAGEDIIQRILKLKKDKHGIMAKPLHTDNYYNTDPLKRKAWRVENGIEKVVGYNEYLWDDIHKNIDDFKNNRKSEMPCVDLVTEQVDRLITDFSTVDMLIVDGLYSIKTNHVDLRIFIELTYLETKEKHTKDSRGKEVMDEVRWAILGQEHKMVQSLKPMADLLITKDYMVVKAK
jgi:uridine kinase